MLNALKATFSTYLAHMAGYIISGATIVSTLAPGTFPPKYAFVTAVATAIATAFSHGKVVQSNAGAIVTAVANAVTESVNTAASTAPNVAKVALLLIALPVMFSLHGCATIQSWLGSPTGEAVVIAGVQVAVTTAEQKGISAAQINSIARTVFVDTQGVAISLSALTAAANAELIKLKLPPNDVAAFQVLEVAFDAYLVSKYGSNETVQNVQADLALFLNQVIADTGG
jgi:hypothetical protein